MIENVSGPLHCMYCGNDGLVVVGSRVERRMEYRDKRGRKVASAALASSGEKAGEFEVEEYGPCQRCEAGHRLEFPPPGKDGNDRRGPWGSDGYWRGRTMDVEPTLGVSLPQAENLRRIKELTESLGLGMDERLAERERRRRAARKSEPKEAA